MRIGGFYRFRPSALQAACAADPEPLPAPDPQDYGRQSQLLTPIEGYLAAHSEAEFSHGICPECARRHYPDLDLYDEETAAHER